MLINGKKIILSPKVLENIKRFIQYIVPSFIIVIVFFLLLEIGSRFYSWYKEDISFFSRNPHPKLDLYIPHPYLISVPKPNAHWQEFSGNLKYSVNSLGYRGKEFKYSKPENIYRIVSLGGSTTWGNNVSDEHTYPQNLENLLNEDLKNKVKFEVINAGVPGYNSAESLINLNLRVLDLSPDMIIIYHTYNDLKVNGYTNFKRDYSHYRSNRGQVEVPFIQTQLRFAYLIFTLERLNYIRRFILPQPDMEGRIDKVSEECISAFKDNLSNMIYLARAHGVDVILCTYANTLTRENLRENPEIFTQILRFVPRLTYDGLIDGFKRYNQAIIEIAEKEKVILINQDELIPKNFDYFADHVHFTEKGTKLFAGNIAKVILQNNLFSSIQNDTLSFNNVDDLDPRQPIDF